MKQASPKAKIWAVLALALLALSIWFGLPPHYRYVAALLAALILPVLFKPVWAFWIVLGALAGLVTFLFTFRASGYHYAALVPLGAGVLLLVFRFGKRGLKRLAAGATGLLLVLLLIPEAPILQAAFAAGESDAPYVIVLGAAVYGQTPSISVRHRCDRAIQHLKRNPGALAVVSGGQGEGEDISEAEAMGRYLVEKGVAADRILLEDKSISKVLIEGTGGDPSRVAVVSSAYHLYRARRMAAALGMDADGLPSADGYPLYMTGMYLREALAVWKLWVMGI